MSSGKGTGSHLGKAKELEKKYSWLEGAKSYEQAINSDSMISYDKAEPMEGIGFCYDLASRQAETVEEFKKLRQLAAEAYLNTTSLLGTEGSLKCPR